MLTRKMLKAMGIEDDKIDQIIEAHTEVTDSLKADRDKYKEQAEKIQALQDEKDALQKDKDALQKEKDGLQKKADEAETYKEKYNTEHKAFENYKTDISEKQTRAKKVDAYKSLLKEAGVSEKRFDAIVKVTAIDDFELEDDGKIKDSSKLVESIKNDWSDFIVTQSQEGASTGNPPKANGGPTMTKEDIMKIKDRNERQKAISENHELFGY